MGDNQPQPNLPTANNNPGDLKDPATGTFQQFSNPQEGFAALMNDLSYKMSPQDKKLGPNATLADFSNVYAPSSDDNNPAEYTAKLANQLGVAPNTTLGSLEPKIGDFANAVANNEGYDEASTVDVSKDPKNQAITTNQNSMPTWEKWVLGGAGALGLAGLGVATGGLGDVAALGTEGALAAGGEAAADAGATAATEGAESGGEGILSKIIGGAKTLAKDAVVGTGINKGIGAVESLFGGNQNQSQPQTEPETTIDGTTLPQSLDATRQIHSGLNEALQGTATGRVYSNTPEAKSGLEGLSQYGITPEVVNGNYDATQAKQDTQTLIGGLSDNMGQVLDAEGESANLNEAISNATANMKKYTPSNEWAEAENHIKKQAETYKQFADENGNISLGTMERMKKEQGMAAGKWDTTTTSAQKAAHKNLYRGARETIKSHTKNGELYERAMKEEQKLINGHKILKRLDGKKAKENKGELKKMIERLAHYSSIAIGDKIGGPLGAIVGEMVGHSIVKYGTRKLGSNILDTPSMKKALELVGKNKPQVLDIIKKEIAKYNDVSKNTKKETKPEEKMTLPEIKEKSKSYKMGTYKLKKNEHTGTYGVGQYRAPNENFYKKIGRPSEKAKELRKKKALAKSKK